MKTTKEHEVTAESILDLAERAKKMAEEVYEAKESIEALHGPIQLWEAKGFEQFAIKASISILTADMQGAHARLGSAVAALNKVMKDD